MKKTKLILLLLFFAIASSNVKAQEKEDYIPLLDTNKTWVRAERHEYSVFMVFDFWIEDTITHNDTLFYELNSSGLTRYFREDIEEKKVYYRHYLNDEEELYYDFSLEVGDCMYLPSGYCFELQDLQIENILGIDRNVYYLGIENSPSYIIWIEGIGSLAGILDPFRVPSLEMSDVELNCCYLEDELIYQSNRATTYGCHLETEPPVIYGVHISDAIINIDETQKIIVEAEDYMSSIYNIQATLTSPNNNEYTCSNFQYSEYLDIYWGSFSDYNNELGYWYVSKIHLEDYQNNVVERNYTFENATAKFLLTDIDNINNFDNNKITVYPNPVNNKLVINNSLNTNTEHSIELYDICGSLIKQQTYKNNSTIDMSIYEKGIYYVKIISNNKTIYTNKLIKQ